jgi:hypothetical protein
VRRAIPGACDILIADSHKIGSEWERVMREVAGTIVSIDSREVDGDPEYQLHGDVDVLIDPFVLYDDLPFLFRHRPEILNYSPGHSCYRFCASWIPIFKDPDTKTDLPFEWVKRYPAPQVMHGGQHSLQWTLDGPGTAIFSGIQNALISPAYIEHRERKGPRIRSGPVKRVLVSFGSADLFGMTELTLEVIASSRFYDCFHFDVVLGPFNQYGHGHDLTERFSMLKNVQFHFGPPSLVTLLAEADAAIGIFSGNSTVECMYVGVPALRVITHPLYLSSRMFPPRKNLVSIDPESTMTAGFLCPPFIAIEQDGETLLELWKESLHQFLLAVNQEGLLEYMSRAAIETTKRIKRIEEQAFFQYLRARVGH